MKKTLLFIIVLIFIVSPTFAQENDELPTEDHINIVLNQFEEHFILLEYLYDGNFDDGTDYVVFLLGDNIRLIVSRDLDGVEYIIGNVNSSETMQEILAILLEIFSEPIAHLAPEQESSFIAKFHDIENQFIHDDFPDYIGSFTVFGSQLFIEEVKTNDNLIIQRQFSTPDFFELLNAELGSDWGFIASWENVEYEISIIEEEIPSQEILPAQFIVRSWRETGDSFSTIAGLPFIYGDQSYWRILFEANRNRLPNRNNPHLIHPGMVLDIPSIRGEERSGIWVPEE